MDKHQSASCRKDERGDSTAARPPSGTVGRDWEKVKKDAERLSQVTGAIVGDGLQEISDRAKEAIRYAAIALVAVLALCGVSLYSLFRLIRGAEVMIREYWNFTSGEELLISGGAGLFLVLVVLGVAFRPRRAAAAISAEMKQTSVPAPAQPSAVSAIDGDQTRRAWNRRFAAISKETQRLTGHIRRAVQHSLDPREWIAQAPLLSMFGGTVAGWFASRSLLRPPAKESGPAPRTASIQRTPPSALTILLRDLFIPALSQWMVASKTAPAQHDQPRSDGVGDRETSSASTTHHASALNGERRESGTTSSFH